MLRGMRYILPLILACSPEVEQTWTFDVPKDYEALLIGEWGSKNLDPLITSTLRFYPLRKHIEPLLNMDKPTQEAWEKLWEKVWEGKVESKDVLAGDSVQLSEGTWQLEPKGLGYSERILIIWWDEEGEYDHESVVKFHTHSRDSIRVGELIFSRVGKQ